MCVCVRLSTELELETSCLPSHDMSHKILHVVGFSIHDSIKFQAKNGGSKKKTFHFSIRSQLLVDGCLNFFLVTQCVPTQRECGSGGDWQGGPLLHPKRYGMERTLYSTFVLYRRGLRFGTEQAFECAAVKQ